MLIILLYSRSMRLIGSPSVRVFPSLTSGLTLIAVIFALGGCSLGGLTFDKTYYERTTGISLPNHYKVLDAFDNGEWLTGVALQVDSPTLRQFVLKYHFDTLRAGVQHQLGFLNAPYFTVKPPAKGSRLFHLSKSGDHNSWSFLADGSTYRLWITIDYPDWGGK